MVWTNWRRTAWHTAAIVAAIGAGGKMLPAQRSTSGLLVRVLAAGSAAPVSGAQVSLVAARASGHTNAAGLVAFGNVPAGEELVEVRALGYTPMRTSLTLTAGDTTAVSFTLAQSTATLAPVTVEARNAPELVRNGFFDRKRSRNGRFFTAKDIAEMHPITPRDILTTVPGMEVNDGGLFATAQQASGACLGVVEYVDGIHVSDPNYMDDRNSHKALAIDNIPIDEIAGIEAYVAPDIPIEYNQEIPTLTRSNVIEVATPCAVVIVWLKHGPGSEASH